MRPPRLCLETDGQKLIQTCHHCSQRTMSQLISAALGLGPRGRQGGSNRLLLVLLWSQSPYVNPNLRLKSGDKGHKSAGRTTENWWLIFSVLKRHPRLSNHHWPAHTNTSPAPFPIPSMLVSIYNLFLYQRSHHILICIKISYWSLWIMQILRVLSWVRVGRACSYLYSSSQESSVVGRRKWSTFGSRMAGSK